MAGLRDPGPGCLAAATLPFLFEPSFTIYGGNILSTLAGEFSFSLSLSVALLFLGVVASGLRTGRYRALAAVLFAVTLLCHLLPALFAAAGAVVWLLLDADVVRGDPPRPPGIGGPAPLVPSAGLGRGRRRHRRGPDRLVAGPLRRRAGVHHQHGLHQGARLPPPAVPGVGPLGAGRRPGRTGGHGGPPQPGGPVHRRHGGDLRRRRLPRPGQQAVQRPVPPLLVPLPVPDGGLRPGRDGGRRGPVEPPPPPRPVGVGDPPAHDQRPCRAVAPRRPDQPVPAADTGWEPAGLGGRPAAGAGRRLPGRRPAPRAAGHHPQLGGRHRRCQPAQRLGRVELLGVPGQAGLSRVPGGHPDDGQRRCRPRAAGGPCGSTTRPSTGSARRWR